MRLALDDADIGDAFAQEAIAHGLAAHAGAHDQHVEHPLAVGAGAFGHPVGRRVVQPREIVGGDLPQRGQARIALDNTNHDVLLTFRPFQ